MTDIPFTRTDYTLSFVLKDHFEVMLDYRYEVTSSPRQGHDVCFYGDTLMTRKSSGELSIITNGLDLHDEATAKLLEYVY